VKFFWTPFTGFQIGFAPADEHCCNTRKRRFDMPLYEHIYMARQDVSTGQVEELTKTLTDLLSANGGTVSKTEYWGLKSLTYRIRKNRKAHYTLLNIEAPAAAVAEMERQMRINEDILRFMTVRVEEHEEGPSAMMQKRDDRDRGDRRGGRRA
jgi:small subunit ribosomal protein S6